MTEPAGVHRRSDDGTAVRAVGSDGLLVVVDQLRSCRKGLGDPPTGARADRRGQRAVSADPRAVQDLGGEERRDVHEFGLVEQGAGVRVEILAGLRRGSQRAVVLGPQGAQDHHRYRPFQTAVQGGGGVLSVGPGEEVLGFVQPQDSARGEGVRVGIEHRKEPLGALRGDQPPAPQTGLDGLEGSPGLARAGLSPHEHERGLLAGSRRGQAVAQLPVVVALDVVGQHECAVGVRRGGAVNGGVDAELLRGPLLDRTGPVEPTGFPALRKILMDVCDVPGGNPAVRGMDNGGPGCAGAGLAQSWGVPGRGGFPIVTSPTFQPATEPWSASMCTFPPTACPPSPALTPPCGACCASRLRNCMAA